jgi:photosystem II stability/assembly factor-like uncharacterized protein
VHGRAASRMDYSICLATTGAGLWTSHDAGKSWRLSACDNPKYPYELCVRAVAAVAARPGAVWASIDGEHGEDVVAKSTDGGDTYAFIGVPAPGRQVWALAVDPRDPGTVIAGSRPAGLYRSSDGGATWSVLDSGVAEEASIGHTRVTAIRYTDVPGEIWASVEIGGLLHSTDGGDTWEKVHTDGGKVLLGPGEVWTDERHFDMHDVAIGQAVDGKRAVFAATPIGFFASEDGGESWRCTRYPVESAYDASLFYSRSLHVNPVEPATVLCGVGRRPPDHGSLGGINRSTDGGLTWRPVSPVLRSVVWKIAAHPADPHLVVAVTLFGQVLTSADGGEHWQPADREFGEIRGVCVTGA